MRLTWLEKCLLTAVLLAFAVEARRLKLQQEARKHLTRLKSFETDLKTTGDNYRRRKRS